MAESPTTTVDLETVQQALKSLRLGTPMVADTPLVGLKLVENILADKTFPVDEKGQVYAVFQLLTETITDGLSRHRAALGLQKPDITSTLANVQKAIEQDGRTENPELIGWSWLYYAYVRVDLHLSAPQFCQYAHLDPRTLRRYQQRAMLRLTIQLIADEQQARRWHSR